jgi:hypothetical protein
VELIQQLIALSSLKFIKMMRLMHNLCKAMIQIHSNSPQIKLIQIIAGVAPLKVREEKEEEISMVTE